MMKRALMIIGIFIFAVSCSRGGGNVKDSHGDYVAKVGNEKLTKEDVQAAWDALPPVSRQVFEGPGGTARFVDEMVRRETLYLEAKKRGLDKDREARLRLEDARKNALVGYLLNKVVEENSPQLTEKAMRDYYFAHKDDFISRDKIRVSQIVVKSQDVAQKVLDRLKAGEDFARVASEVSIDKATARSGGDMGFIDRNSKMASQLVQEILKTRKGEISRPVTMPDGIHILKVTDIKGAVSGYGQVKDIIAQKMAMERKKAAMDKLLDSVKKSYTVDINRAAVAQLPPLSPPDKGSLQLPPGHPSLPTP
jgi:peptidyl-prolyl cis-trans isomerase C